MLIKPADRTIKNLLEGSFFSIPRFQRPYSWDKENVDDFWNDAIANDDPDYFIGSFVLYRQAGQADSFMIVDGQQRLTTITLILAAVRNALATLGRRELAEGVQKLIEREDIDNKKCFVLGTETSYPYFQEYIQKHGTPSAAGGDGAEEESLRLAFEYLQDNIGATLDAVDADPTVALAKKPDEKRRRLLRIRDNILRLQLIVVELTNEDDAYLIFETLNTRGKDLGIADLVKNLFARSLKPTHKGVDIAKDKWNAIRSMFEASAANLDLNSFVYHAWLSRHPYTGKDKLFKEIKARVTNKNAMSMLDDLLADADLYRQLLEPAAHGWPKQERDIASSLRALTVFRVLQPVPMTLSILRTFRAGGLTTRQTKAILREMENFHVQFTAVTNQRTGGGTARMYAASAEALTVAPNKNKRAQILKEFKAKMRARIPSQQEFEANFHEVSFFSENTKQRALVQYLLRRFDQHLRTGPPVDYDSMTIEHIAPENGTGPGVSSTRLGKIGNLLLLPDSENVKLGTKDIKAKRLAYKSLNVPLDPVLARAPAWTDAEIDRRTSHLAKVAFEEVFKV